MSDVRFLEPGEEAGFVPPQPTLQSLDALFSTVSAEPSKTDQYLGWVNNIIAFVGGSGFGGLSFLAPAMQQGPIQGMSTVAVNAALNLAWARESLVSVFRWLGCLWKYGLPDCDLFMRIGFNAVLTGGLAYYGGVPYKAMLEDNPPLPSLLGDLGVSICFSSFVLMTLGSANEIATDLAALLEVYVRELRVLFGDEAFLLSQAQTRHHEKSLQQVERVAMKALKRLSDGDASEVVEDGEIRSALLSADLDNDQVQETTPSGATAERFFLALFDILQLVGFYGFFESVGDQEGAGVWGVWQFNVVVAVTSKMIHTASGAMITQIGEVRRDLRQRGPKAWGSTCKDTLLRVFANCDPYAWCGGILAVTSIGLPLMAVFSYGASKEEAEEHASFDGPLLDLYLWAVIVGTVFWNGWSVPRLLADGWRTLEVQKIKALKGPESLTSKDEIIIASSALENKIMSSLSELQWRAQNQPCNPTTEKVIQAFLAKEGGGLGLSFSNPPSDAEAARKYLGLGNRREAQKECAACWATLASVLFMTLYLDVGQDQYVRDVVSSPRDCLPLFGILALFSLQGFYLSNLNEASFGDCTLNMAKSVVLAATLIAGLSLFDELTYNDLNVVDVNSIVTQLAVLIVTLVAKVAAKKRVIDSNPEGERYFAVPSAPPLEGVLPQADSSIQAPDEKIEICCVM